MSKTHRKVGIETPKSKVKTKTRRCESCGEVFPAEDVFRDVVDPEGRFEPVGESAGWFCGGCI